MENQEIVSVVTDVTEEIKDIVRDKDVREKILKESRITREKWLEDAYSKLKGVFPASYDLPQTASISVGDCGMDVLGRCYNATIHTGNLFTIILDFTEDRPLNVLGTLLHEMIHCLEGCRNHGNKFMKVCFEVGLAMVCKNGHTEITEQLKPRLEKIAQELGPFPHKKIVRPIRDRNMREPAIKLICINGHEGPDTENLHCEYRIKEKFFKVKMEAFKCPVCDRLMQDLRVHLGTKKGVEVEDV